MTDARVNDRCEGQSVILKRVSEHVYGMCQKLNARFAGSRRLRLHIDQNEEERTLVFDHLRGNLFHFMNAYNQVPPVEITNQIMWEIGKALEEMHDGKMMHAGKSYISPQKIMRFSQKIHAPSRNI